MEKLFVLASEITAFEILHPEYNNYKKVYNKYRELVGYVVSIKNENIEEN